VTGGLGFIGSHVAAALLEKGYTVHLVDNLAKSSLSRLSDLQNLYPDQPISFTELDCTNSLEIDALFSTLDVEGVIHCAGYKSVQESIANPLNYYRNNLLSTITLLEACLKFEVPKFIFSSSATVYGKADSPIVEQSPIGSAETPYGETKAMSERILSDTQKANPSLSITALRYFNPVGAHPSGLIGEGEGSGNLMPAILRTANKLQSSVTIHGFNYPTKDGTCVRDFIHVMDLAEGHVAALESEHLGYTVVNLGTGNGTTVKELITTFERVNRITIPVNFGEEREGDLPSCYADVQKAYEIFGWRASRSLEDMCVDAWRYECFKLRMQLKN